MDIYTPIKTDIMLRNFTPFKKLLEPLKVRSDLKFINEIFKRADDLGSLIHQNVSPQQVMMHNELSIVCKIKFDLGFEIWSDLGSGFNYGVLFNDQEVCSVESFKKEIEGKMLNKFIVATSMTLNQKVNNIESSFIYKVQ